MFARHRCVFFLLLMMVLAAAVPVAAQVDPDHDHDSDLHHGHDHPPGAVCGTMLWMQWRNAQEHPELLDPRVPHLMAQIPCSNTRPIKQNSILTAQRHFRIHYDTQGGDAVPATDANNNSIPDYIDSVDYYLEDAWEKEINVYGFLAPLPDNRGPGPEVDVFICNLGGAIYGLARPEEDLPTGPNTVSGFLVLDNDYREPYFSRNIAGLRVTIAHEFHHIVQFSRYRFDFSQSALYEATSVWFERQLHPSIPDYSQYTDTFLRAPQKYGLSTHKTYAPGDVTGYAHVLYFSYLEKRLDDKDVVRKIWEEFRTREIAFDAIDHALRGYSLNLSDSYCEFAEWSYYTGVRSKGTTYFIEASSFPTMGVATFRTYDEDASLMTPGELYPLSFGLYRFSVLSPVSGRRDTVDFLITNARTNFGKGGAGIDMDMFNLELSRTERDGFRPLRLRDSSNIYFRLNAPSPQFCVNPIIGGSSAVLLTTVVAPQPFINDGAAPLVFGVNLAKEQVTHARLVIYSVSMTPVTEITTTELQSSNNLLGLVWRGTDFRGELVPSGVYIYEFTINNEAPILGKIAVIKK